MKKASKAGDLPQELLNSLNEGIIATSTYVEMTAVDFQQLMSKIAPNIPFLSIQQAFVPKTGGFGITTRMARAGFLLAKERGKRGYVALCHHPSDTVRGWAAYTAPHLWPDDLAKQLAAIKPLAEDPHFGVREWAWLALRPQIAKNIKAAIELLKSWVHHSSANLRRFAIESTRPRGFWSKHIQELKECPALGLCLLNPLFADPSRYVQLAVANWLNDASKHQPLWVEKLCACRSKDKSAATAFIIKRALRTLSKRSNPSPKGGLNSLPLAR